MHISEVDWSHLQTLDGVLKEGDIVEVKLIEVDKKTGKMKLSRKVLLPRPERVDQPERPERHDRPEGMGFKKAERHDKPEGQE